MASSDFWTSGDTAMLAAHADLLPDAIAAAEAALAPAGPAIISKAVEVLAALPAQRRGDADAKMAMRVYLIGLKDVPRDLLSLAVERACQRCEWRPPPAALRALVADELDRRRLALARLRSAAARLARREDRPDDAERQRVAASMAELLARLDARAEGGN